MSHTGWNGWPSFVPTAAEAVGERWSPTGYGGRWGPTIGLTQSFGTR